MLMEYLNKKGTNMTKKKIAFICQKSLESFIEPIVQEFEKLSQYQIRRYYITTQQEINAACKWGDIIWLEWCNETAIVATQIYDLKKKGVVIRLHSYEALANYPSQIDWSMVDYLVFVAPHIREIVKRQVPDIRKRVCTKVIYNGLDIDKIPANKVRNEYDMAYVCNINHKKAPLLALQIMAKLNVYNTTQKKAVKRSTVLKLHSAGRSQDERYKIYLEHMAKEMGIEDNIIYYGFVKDMEGFWEGKGIILSTSIHEGHPLNIMEGMARGLKPVIHNFYGAKDLYREEWLYNTVDEAVEMICSVRKNDYRQYIIDKGWTLDNQIKQIKALIGRLAKKGK